MIIDMSPRGFLYVIFRHKWLFILSVLGCVGAASTYCLLATRTYRTDAEIVIKFANGSGSEIPGTAISAQSTEHQEVINTNVALLNSADLLNQLLRDVGVVKLYPKLAAAADVDPKSLLDRARARLAHDLKVTPTPNSDVIELSLDNPDASTAATTLSRLIEIFAARETRLYRSTQSWWMRDQVEDARRRLSLSQANLDKFVSKFGISSLDDERTALLQLEMNTRSELEQQQSKLAEADQPAAVGRRGARQAEARDHARGRAGPV